MIIALLILKLKKEVIVKADNDVWTMTVTSKETDSDGVSKKSEFISGSQEEIMEAMLEHSKSEAMEIAKAAGITEKRVEVNKNKIRVTKTIKKNK